MKNEKLFVKLIYDAWEALKNAYHPRYRAKLRRTLLQIIAADGEEFSEFVDLMRVSGWDPVEAVSLVTTADAAMANSAKNKPKAKRKNHGKINKELDEAAGADVAIIQCKGCGQFTEATGAKNFADGVFCDKCINANNDEPVLHQCHYCGDMYHVSDLTGAKMGLICYKCRHEMENRD